MYSLLATTNDIVEDIILQRIDDIYQGTHSGILNYDQLFFECTDIWGGIYVSEKPHVAGEVKKALEREDFDGILNEIIQDEYFFKNMLEQMEVVLFKHDIAFSSQDERYLFNKWAKDVW